VERVVVIETHTFLDDVPYFWEMLFTVITWVVAIVFITFNKRLFTKLDKELLAADVHDRSIKALDQMMDFITVVVAVFVTLYIWGVDEMLYAALTTVGVIGLMLAFAIKDIASNFISGILLILSKDLLIGDAIEVNGIEGRIEKITIRTTSVRRYDGALAIVPNSMILNEPVVDFSATDKRRVEVKVVLPSTVDIPTATEALKEAAGRETRRLGDESIDVLLKGFDASIMTLELRFWVSREDLVSAKSDAHGHIQEALSKVDIVLDVPTSIEVLGGATQTGKPSDNL
jgi:small-conductance mechanosensitive channel